MRSREASGDWRRFVRAGNRAGSGAGRGAGTNVERGTERGARKRAGALVAGKRASVRVAGALWLLAGLSLFAGCGDDKSTNGTPGPTTPSHPQDLIPPSGGGLTRSGEMLLADTAQELQQAIDGGYSLYTQYSFQEFAGQEFHATVDGNQQTVRIWVFRMGTAQNAQDLHNDSNNQMGTPTSEYGSEARIEISSATTIRFWRDVYWTLLTIDSSSANAQTLLALLARNIDDEIKP